MALSREMQIAKHRVVMFALGSVAALALWALSENWDNPVLSGGLYLALFTFVATYSAVALALAGPVSTGRALMGALLLAIPVTALISLAGQRYGEASDLLDDPRNLSVALALVFFSTPFLLVWLCNRADWRRYAVLFDAAWSMSVRYVVALAFVGMFWLAAFLSNALLELVEIDLIDRMLRVEWIRFGLSGGVLGLGLAVVYELRETISPHLILRLLRLMVPLMLVVVVVFLGALPFRGVSRLFGEFSAASTLMGTAIAAISLISIALDRGEAGAVATGGIRLATRGLAVLLPLLTGLALWAVVLRVRQYGWTPDRVVAGCMAVFLLCYGLGYFGAVLGGRGWGRRIRMVNVVMALALIAATALWMTPVLNAYQISSASQVNRFAAGKSTLDQLTLWPLQHEWGLAGLAGLNRLEAMTGHKDHDMVLARVAAVRNQPNKYAYEQLLQAEKAPDHAQRLAELMQVRPVGSALSAETFAGLAWYRMEQWLDGCKRQLPDGRAGCVLVRARFSPKVGAEIQGMVLFLDEQGRARGNYLSLGEGPEIDVREVFDPVAGKWPILPGATVAQVLDGAFEIRPSGGNALFVGDLVLVPGH